MAKPKARQLPMAQVLTEGWIIVLRLLAEVASQEAGQDEQAPDDPGALQRPVGGDGQSVQWMGAHEVLAIAPAEPAMVDTAK